MEYGRERHVKGTIQEIESRTAPVYEQLMERAKRSADAEINIDSRMLAFFFGGV
jgi:hypothetical protein